MLNIMINQLAKFIHLAANVCEYDGCMKKLICNWIHPLFLKAKAAASSEDNPDWQKAMQVSFADQF